jgi:hypothetical protein
MCYTYRYYSYTDWQENVAESINSKKRKEKMHESTVSRAGYICLLRATSPPKRKKRYFFLANEKAVGDCERTRRPNYYEPDVVARRVFLYRHRPHLESPVRKIVWRGVRTYIAAKEGSKPSRKRDYALRDTICQANDGWRRHCNR